MSDFNEAVVLIAKCGERHKTYGMRLEKTGHDRWLTTWAFPIKESSAKREGYDKVQEIFHLQMTIPDVLIAVATG